MVFSGILILLIIWLNLIERNFADCTNDSGTCSDYGSYIICYLDNNNFESVKSLLWQCTQQRSAQQLYVDKNYISSEYGYLIIDIELPSSIQALHIRNYQDRDHFRLTTSSQNTGLTRFECFDNVQLESKDFFNNFVNLRNIVLTFLVSKDRPSFTKLQYLTHLTAWSPRANAQPIDSSMFSGLTNLIALDLSSSNFNGLTEGAFDSLKRLTYLRLNYNEIHHFSDGSLSELLELKQLHLVGNEVNTVSNYVFKSLTQLSLLDLNDNPGFPLETLKHAKSVERLYLQYNNYPALDPFVFQQLKRLTFLSLDNQFICDCRLQWISLIKLHGITIDGGYCLEPFEALGDIITSKQLYTNCTQTQSYHCFNETTVCDSNEVCINTEYSYSCECDRGYTSSNLGQCNDINECIEVTNCQHFCENTDGSFQCGCKEGYKLAANGYDCDDINECQELNGRCEFGCRNTIGSYSCYCEYGHELYNGTGCKSDIQCELFGRSCSQETHSSERENSYSCKGGFTIFINNLTCKNTANGTRNDSETTVSTQIGCKWTFASVLLITTSFSVVGIQALIIVVILVYFLKKIKSLKRLFKISGSPREYKNIINAQHDKENTGQSPGQELPIQGSSALIYPDPYPQMMQEVVHYTKL